MSHQWDPEERLRRAGNLNGVVPASHNRGAVFIGDVTALTAQQDHLRFGISAAVTCLLPSEMPRVVPPSIRQHFIISLEDEEESPISDYFEAVFQFIQDASLRGNVLIHCRYGISRSATLTIAYLMRRLGWNTSKAYSYLKGVRDVVCPNMSFCKQLIEYQKTLQVSNEWEIVQGRLVYQSPPEVKASLASTNDSSEELSRAVVVKKRFNYTSGFV